MSYEDHHFLKENALLIFIFKQKKDLTTTCHGFFAAVAITAFNWYFTSFGDGVLKPIKPQGVSSHSKWTF